MRCDKSPVEIFAAVELICSIGRIARETSQLPTAKPKIKMTTPATASFHAVDFNSCDSGSSEQPTLINSPDGKGRLFSHLPDLQPPFDGFENFHYFATQSIKPNLKRRLTGKPACSKPDLRPAVFFECFAACKLM
jgi:hypothetical protein